MTWASYAAAAFAFAAVSAYWDLGGKIGLETIAAHIAQVPLANSPVVVWDTAPLKVLARLMALATV